MVPSATDVAGIRDGRAQEGIRSQGEASPDEARAQILVVDDDPHILRLCQHYLTAGEGIAPDGIELRLLSAGSGAEALALVRQRVAAGERIACALVDVLLPDGPDGIETICRLWEIDPDVQCTLMTGMGARIAQEIAGRLPEDRLDRWDYFTKPFTAFEITQRMRRALAAWLAHRGEARRAAENERLLLHLSRANLELEETVRERTSALALRSEEQERKNVELERAMRELESAQGKLLQQEKMACIGQLAAGVAHELNNPIGFVHSNLGTLRRYVERIRGLIGVYEAQSPPGNGEIARTRRELKVDFMLQDLPALVEESLEGTERMRKIVADLKVFSHPAEQTPKYADLNEGLRSTLNIVHNEIKYKAEVKTEFGDIPPVLCLGGQLNQVFMNLLVNAAQAIAESGVITVATHRGGDEVEVRISDTGCGIPEELLSRIFDPFFTTKDVGKGTGLGLSISCDIVRRHGGTIRVESTVGVGTTFRIRLPVEGGGNLHHDG